MKQLFLLLLCVTSLGLSAQEEIAPKGEPTGMQFVEKPFAELLAQAKTENKVIFVDAYTTWCGPCKMMSAQVFPLPEVGAVYNERFINAKIDMEKGEGPELAKRYGVMAYPTYLFVDGNGDIVHRGVGYIPGEQFLALADAASGEDNLGSLNKKFDAGERDPNFLRTYATTLMEVYDQQKADEVTGIYLETKEDWSDAETLQLLAANPGEPGGKRMNYLLENSAAVMKEIPAEQFIMTLQQKLVTAKMQELGQRALPSTEEMAGTYDKYGGAMTQQLKDHYAMFSAEQMRDNEKYIPAALHYLETYGSEDAMQLNGIAWTIFESSEDKEQLAAALEMAKKSVALEEGYANMDTLAWLYHKTGNGKMAKETAKKAIELAKATGQDYSDTAKILEK